MSRDSERIDRIQMALCEANLDALACTLPANVRLLTGYWPVIGTAVALVIHRGATVLLVPEDEQDLAERGWADEVHTFRPASLNELTSATDAIRAPLGKVARSLLPGRGRLGHEAGESSEPASYAALHLYGSQFLYLLDTAFPAATLTAADSVLAQLRSVKTPHERECLRAACRVAGLAFDHGAEELQAGLSETQVVHQVEGHLSIAGLRLPGVARAGGFVYCMSGPNSAEAGAAYARTRDRRVKPDDLVLVHCNSYMDGLWTDITRTYCLGPAEERQDQMYAAVLAAREAALATIRPGVTASIVDAAARAVIQEHGFGGHFTHGLGHGVGFAAIDANARPRLHPASRDVLEEGMVFNVEPAVYLSGFGGLRHCDMVAVSRTGAEILTPFQSMVEQLILAGGPVGSGAGRAET